jgi:uncharacterized protein (DUF924 family)
VTPREIVDFWMAAGFDRWFGRDAAFDGVISVRYGKVLREARAGHLDHWAEEPVGAVGLVIVLDQFSRNLCRGTPLAFAADGKALALAKQAIGRGFHWRVTAPEAMWLCMPFEHAENIDDQNRCIGLFQLLGNANMVYWAGVHRDVIARFGRFPHRNKVLGRTSTAAELAFLAAGGFSA